MSVFIVDGIYMKTSYLRILVLSLFFVCAFTLSFFALAETVNQSDLSSVRVVPVYDTYTPWVLSDFHSSLRDMEQDDSLQKFLDDDHAFTDIDYIPIDLVPISSDFTANVSTKFLLRAEAALQFADMARHFWHNFSGDRLFITSTYRSPWLQKYLLKQWCKLIKCAQAGTSEHQAGLALDLKVVTKWGRTYSLDIAYPNKYYTWLQDNAATFGFHNTYQKWVAIDGKMAEGWHRRYLGKQLATLLMDNKQTFAEYYNNDNW